MIDRYRKGESSFENMTLKVAKKTIHLRSFATKRKFRTVAEFSLYPR